MRPYFPGGSLHGFPTAPTTVAPWPTPSEYRLRLGLPGYLIRFVPLAFVPCRQVRSGETPSPLVVLQGLQDFTPTPEVPLTSPGLEPRQYLLKAQQLSCWISQETYPAGYRPFRPNNNGYHSSRRCYRGGWHRSCPALAMQCFLGIATARFITWHSRFPYRRCRHCKVFAPAAPRRAWIRVSESISGLLLSQPVPVVG